MAYRSAHAGEPALIRSQRLALASIGIGLVVLALKTLAWWLTGSAALFSDATETVVNVAAGVLAFAALSFAARPADDNHPFGHDKAEFFAAVVEGVLIIVASLGILLHAWEVWWAPVPIARPALGLGLTAMASLLNLGWALVLLRLGRRLRSPVLVADGRHLVSDVVTSIALIAGVGLVLATGLEWLDPLLAAAAALYILASGLLVVRDSVAGLMDAAPAPAVVERIRDLVASHADGAIEAHDLRTRHAGRLTFLEFHLVVPGGMTVSAAHDICDRLESVLEADMDGLVVTIHVEPDSKAKHHGVLVL